MKHIRIDFVPRSPRSVLYAVHPLALIAIALGATLCAIAAVQAYDVMQQRRALKQELRQLHLQAAGPTTPKQQLPSNAIPEGQARSVNSAILQLNLPWRALQVAVGEGTPAHIGLLALEPDPRKQVLKISAESRSVDDMIAYIEQLKRQEFFSDASLTRHEILETDANRPVRFQVEAQWRSR